MRETGLREKVNAGGVRGGLIAFPWGSSRLGRALPGSGKSLATSEKTIHKRRAVMISVCFIFFAPLSPS